MSAKTEAETATQNARDLIAILSDEASDLTNTDIERQVGAVREQLDAAMDGLIDEFAHKATQAVYALQSLAEAVMTLGLRRIEEGSLLTDYTLEQSMPVTLLAHLLYGDVERAADLHLHNTLTTPNAIPSGSVLRVPRS